MSDAKISRNAKVSRDAQAKPKSVSGRSAVAIQVAQPLATSSPPFKPHPWLFITLLLVWVIWIGALLAMYFTTVFPNRIEPNSAHHAAVEWTKP